MNAFLRALNFSTLFAACLTGSPNASEPAPSNRPFLPEQILIGPHWGITASHLTGSSDYRALFRPTAPKQAAYTSSSYGALITARWRRGLSLTFAPRYESYGLDTREETVSFTGNPFPHTLRSSTEIGYKLFPLLLGLGWFSSRQHFQIQLGGYAAFLDDAKIAWTVDGNAYPNGANSQRRDSQTGWLLGTEYGVRMGPGDLILGIEAQRQAHSMLQGLAGSVQAQSGRVSLAYAWTVLRR